MEVVDTIGEANNMQSTERRKTTGHRREPNKVGGILLSALDMEDEIVSHPMVLEAAVVGIAHAKLQERPLALVVLQHEFKKKASKKEILDHLGKRFAKWQIPDKILFVETIPKTSVGKIDKKVIRAEYHDIYTSR